jgi:hypothetical protein
MNQPRIVDSLDELTAAMVKASNAIAADRPKWSPAIVGDLLDATAGAIAAMPGQTFRPTSTRPRPPSR